jgi:NhaA family Na+:H+ antiporter
VRRRAESASQASGAVGPLLHDEVRVSTGPLFAAVVRPIQAFLRTEAASGVLLLGCAVVALALANSPLSGEYHALLSTPLGLRAGPLGVELTLAALVNDGLMTVFFFVVGMEIKRELAIGELRTLRQALLPLVAALGGMLVPASIFLAFNAGTPAAAGWGVPMATDIAFCVGVLTLLRSRVPYALVVFVTALAIFDDLGGILVIALFYGHGLDPAWLTLAGGATAVLVLMGRASARSPVAYAAVGAVLWLALHHGGIHATVAGVITGLAIPARAQRASRSVLHDISVQVTELLGLPADEELDSAAVAEIEERLEELESPLTRLVHGLHGWVAFGIMPLFALANAGVDLRALEPAQLAGPVAVGTGLALLVGKQVGIFVSTWLAVRAGLAPMPGGASAAKLLGVSAVAGIGFTVALFIAGLAYAGSPEVLDQAKVGILGGSLVAGLAGAALLRMTAPVDAPAADAEPASAS